MKKGDVLNHNVVQTHAVAIVILSIRLSVSHTGE